jgi:hypothetical protein
MHQTTLRFSGELWEALEEECARVGVSVAQFVREAALTRLAYAAGKRGDERYERAMDLAGGEDLHDTEAAELEAVAGPVDRGTISLGERSRVDFAESAALAAQGRMARQRSRELREQRARRHDP